MNLLRIRLRAFRSFIEEQEFVFPRGPGLFFMTGNNLVNPRLGPNAVGKTTLWEALTWLLFEKTSKGLKAGDVAPWSGEKGTRVEADYEIDGHVYTIGRTWSPNRWWLRHPSGDEELLTKDSTNSVLSQIAVGFQPYLHSILTAQGQPMFLDLKADAAAALFSQVLNLDHWLEQSAKAAKLAANEDMKVRRLESVVSGLQGQLSSASLNDETVASLEDLASEWDKEQERREDELSTLIELHLGFRKGFVDKAAPIEARVSDLRGLIRKAVAQIDTLDKDRPNLERRVRELERSSGALQERASRALKELDAIDLDNPCYCTQCTQLVPPGLLESQVHKLSDEAERLSDEAKTVAAELHQAEHDLESLRERTSSANKVLDDHRRNLKYAEMDLQAVDMSIATTDKRLDEWEDELERLEDSTNPHLLSLQAEESRRDALASKLSDTLFEKDAAETRCRLFQFWVKGFKDIRLEEISKALTQLEIEVNSCVAQLGLVGWELLFDADSETKSGTLKRGFSVKVLSPANSKPVPWDSWSGGESQRLRVAGNEGLANLIRDRMGVTLPLEVWDEPTQFLSPQGVTDLLDSLSARALEYSRQIWVVDHRSLGYGGFDGTVVVVKGKQGSHFDMSACID